MTAVETLQAFFTALANLPIDADPRHIAEDIRDLRIAFPDDNAFVHALQSLVYELRIASQRPSTHGIPLEYRHTGWRRAAFQSRRSAKNKADLRIIFRPTLDGRLELRAFGHRREPLSVSMKVR